MNNTRAGYTLIEIMVVAGVLAGLFAITGAVLVQSAKVWQNEQTYASVSAGMRDAALAITRELEFARLEPDIAAVPPVSGVTIGDTKGTITFQTPASADGTVWNPPVTFQLRSEDLNGNLALDSGEDLDQNRVLDRVIERRQDINGDKKIRGSDEVRVIARGIDRLSFLREPNSAWVEVAIEARVVDPGRAGTAQSQISRFSVRVKN